uniref:LIM zinc-binding domain-containing protein n=1 Tax=Esox lucius TaxID=8010 RepID=A0A6Q2X2J0_ESOLU
MVFDKEESVSLVPLQSKGKPRVCAGCNRRIRERFMLQALDRYWHEDCLKCACCDCRLGELGSTLFTRANLILCRRDYLRLFGMTGNCAACSKIIPAFEMVMRAKDNVYHLDCFACQLCSQSQFSQLRAPGIYPSGGCTDGKWRSPVALRSGCTDGKWRSPVALRSGCTDGKWRSPVALRSGCTDGKGRSPVALRSGCTDGKGRSPVALRSGCTDGKWRSPVALRSGCKLNLPSTLSSVDSKLFLCFLL